MEKFYPHPTFIKLLKSMVDVLSRKQKLSVWVDGAYGTGKSHAVLTLKKLIEASDEETNAYFERYNLDNFLCQKLIAQKTKVKFLFVIVMAHLIFKVIRIWLLLFRKV